MDGNSFKLLVLCTIIIVISIIFFLQRISSEFYQEMQKQREAELTRLVDIADNAISPVIEKVKSGQLTKEEAITQVREIVRKMTYNDEFGKNYIFMSS